MYHGCAAGLIYGRAGEAEFSDEVVNEPRVVALRGKVQATVDSAVREESVHVTAFLNDGRQIRIDVEHAIGSLQRPLSDAQLESKFGSLVVPVLGEQRAAEITNDCWNLAAIDDVNTLTSRCRP